MNIIYYTEVGKTALRLSMEHKCITVRIGGQSSIGHSVCLSQVQSEDLMISLCAAHGIDYTPPVDHWEKLAECVNFFTTNINNPIPMVDYARMTKEMSAHFNALLAEKVIDHDD